MDTMEFTFQDTKELHKIKVFGIGGGGNNAINNMIEAGVIGPMFIAANSDMQALERCLAPHKIQVGAQLTRGLGCGGKSSWGRAATQEDLDRIKDMLGDSDMVFITAGMGGGTGSGGAPVVAEALSKLNNPPLIVAVVTKPFKHEGPRRMAQALADIEELKLHCDCILVVPNQKLMAALPKGSPILAALQLADTVLLKAVQGITDLITGKGLINVDFQDLKTAMSKRGPAIMGVGQASGDDRAVKAAQQAVSSPLLDDLSLKGAKGVLINITGPKDIALDETSDICDLITAEAHEDADIFYGVAIDDELEESGSVKVTVIATGLVSAEDEARAQAAREAEERARAEAEERARAEAEERARAEAEAEAEKRAADEAAAQEAKADEPPARPQVEQIPARPRLADTSGLSRRNRAASYSHDALDGPDFMRDLDVPTYLRRRAD